MYRILEPQLQTRLREMIQTRHPHEAVGLILPDGSCHELANMADFPAAAFMISGAEVGKIITDGGFELEIETLEQTTLWHSHPGGGVGPSRIDMLSKAPYMSHLIITPVEDDLIFSWY